MTDEIRAHLDGLADRNLKAGLSPEEARYAALRQFGNVASIQEQAREVRSWVWLEQAWQDLHYAVRSLGRTPGFTLTAILTLALGLGVNCALFSAFDAVVLRSLPLKQAEELVNIVGRNDLGWELPLFSYSDYLDLRAGQRGVPTLAAWMELPIQVDRSEVQALSFVEVRGIIGQYARLPLQLVSQNYFEVLGTDLALGRGFRPEENLKSGANPVIILQYQFWVQQFHRDPKVLGQTIKLGETVFTVIGVAASDFAGKKPAPPIGWVPIMMFDALIGNGSQRLVERHNNQFQLVARVPAGPVREQARAELEVLSRQLAQKYHTDHPRARIEFADGGKFFPASFNWQALVFLAPVWLSFAMVLCIACANVAILMLARASTRQQEIGVRLALGAGRGRIVRHLLMESLLVALAGGLAGLLVATWTLLAVRPWVITKVPALMGGVRDWWFINLTPDYRVFGFTLSLALGTALAAGLFPALQAARLDVNAALKIGGALFSQRSRLRHALVVGQVAMCLTLLTESALLVRHVARNATVETGMNTKDIYAVDLSVQPVAAGTPPGAAHHLAKKLAPTPDARREAVAFVRTLPGIKAIALAYRVPFQGPLRLTPVAIDDRGTAADPLLARFNFVSAEYFALLGLAVAKGRAFTASEVERKVPVVVISEAAAQRYWPGENPLGKHLKISSVASEGGWVAPPQRQQSVGVFSSYEVIGVAVNTRSGMVWAPDESMIYLPVPLDSWLAHVALLQFTGPRATALPLALGAASAQGQSLELEVYISLDEARDFQLLPFSGAAAVGASLGLLALVMAVVGLYGVMTFVVSQRVREIGIRTALGATGENIVSLFVRQGMRLVAMGLATGGIAGVGLAILLSKLVPGAQPFDPPLACGGVALLLLFVTLLACWLPARRAAKVDPMVALRAE